MQKNNVNQQLTNDPMDDLIWNHKSKFYEKRKAKQREKTFLMKKANSCHGGAKTDYTREI